MDGAAATRCNAAMRPLLICLLCMAACAPAAATVYRWVDDQGRTHFADTVPERYRDRARPVDLRDDTPTEAERRQAEERAARERARLAPPADGPAAASRPAASAPAAARRPPAPPSADTDCETWRRLYEESLACFGPYRNVRGAPRPEAFERCTPVDEPPPRCGRPQLR